MYHKKIHEYFTNSGIVLPESAIYSFSKFLELLLYYNKTHDLTRINSIDEIIIKHFVDSLYISTLFTIPTPLLDIGTGAGFPGIPLAIAHRNTNFILAESRYKRVEFLNIVKNELQLKNVEIYPHLVTEKSFFNVSGVVTRAVESIQETLNRCNHFLKKDDVIIFMKGPSADEELIESNEQFINVVDQYYVLPNTTYQRRLIVYKKMTEHITKVFYISKEGISPDGVAVVSEENKRFKEFKKIASNPKKFNTTIISGKKIIKELINNNPEICEYILLYDEYKETDTAFITLLSDLGFKKIVMLKKSLFNELDITEAKQPLMIAKVPPLQDWDFSCNELSLMLPLQDPVNIGAAVRSSVAFGVKHIIINQNAAYPYHPKSVRASSGAVFNCIIEKAPPIQQVDYEKIKCPIIALDLEGEDITSFVFPKNCILVPGIEGPGLPDIKNCIKLTIPIEGVESLNTTVALSIALYEWHKQQKH